MLLASISSSFLSFQFVRSGAANVDVHAQVCGLLCVLFMILCGFAQAKALNLGVLPMIARPAPRCGCHLLLFAMLSGFLEAVNSPSFVRRLVAL